MLLNWKFLFVLKVLDQVGLSGYGVTTLTGDRHQLITSSQPNLVIRACWREHIQTFLCSRICLGL